ncbi:MULTISPECIES: hypothetical protein [Actinosynnema]|uniref:F0F1-ATPase subunit n=3 Tax=Actinosynnema TaxID=40566 RepID=C6WHK1_ACTMD|nr:MULTISPECIES: hypothetical protein [Actinosynnema]ACU39950.1 hypothetical protein Amir_6143 [Actinosynnema mirum DSM 43827]ATE57040.1 hypothetical protein CNX65_30235 [Actinosynnema pretiosum]MCP2099374.1 putative F0F1-ATPase subunit (ATPase_gene1) [Actinosynnema pretiosum]QUF02732.1 hypothetical protein KCV87_25215 [Actinosynnema pretiosum subsp. pretiosum]
MSDKSDKPPPRGDGAVWSIIGTLVSGPAVWGGIGFLIDKTTESQIFTPIGLTVGFVTGFYIVYVRHGQG